jgi:hypothetical protein
MTHTKDTIDMAREVKMPYDFVTGEPIYIEKLKAFEALVRADEREQALAAPVPLTDEQLLEILTGIDSETKRLPSGFKNFARAIESAHGITKGQP